MKLVVLFGIIVGFLLFRFLKKKVFSNTVKFSYSVISFLLCSIVGILSVYVVLNLLGNLCTSCAADCCDIYCAKAENLKIN